MIDIMVTETCRAAGRNQSWAVFKEHVLFAEDIKEAHNILRGYLEHIYNVRRRKPIFVDTKSKGTLHSGWIYSGIEDTTYLQAWCSFYDHKTRLHVNPKTGAKYYTDSEALQIRGVK